MSVWVKYAALFGAVPASNRGSDRSWARPRRSFRFTVDGRMAGHALTPMRALPSAYLNVTPTGHRRLWLRQSRYQSYPLAVGPASDRYILIEFYAQIGCSPSF